MFFFLVDRFDSIVFIGYYCIYYCINCPNMSLNDYKWLRKLNTENFNYNSNTDRKMSKKYGWWRLFYSQKIAYSAIWYSNRKTYSNKIMIIIICVLFYSRHSFTQWHNEPMNQQTSTSLNLVQLGYRFGQNWPVPGVDFAP